MKRQWESYSTERGGLVMSLSMMSVGESGRIIEFRGKDSMKRHLQDLGFIKGEKI